MATWYGGSFDVPWNKGDNIGALTAQWFVTGDIGSDLSLGLQSKIAGTKTKSGQGTNVYYPNMKLYVSIDGNAEVTMNTRGNNSLWLDSLHAYQKSFMPNANTYYQTKNVSDDSNWRYNVGKARIVKVRALATSSQNGCDVTTNAAYTGFLFGGSPSDSFYQIDSTKRTIYINNIRIYDNGGWHFCVPYVYSGGWKNAYTYVYNGTAWKECRS